MPNQREALQNLILQYQAYKHRGKVNLEESIRRMKTEQARVRKEAQKLARAGSR